MQCTSIFRRDGIEEWLYWTALCWFPPEIPGPLVFSLSTTEKKTAMLGPYWEVGSLVPALHQTWLHPRAQRRSPLHRRTCSAQQVAWWALGWWWWRGNDCVGLTGLQKCYGLSLEPPPCLGLVPVGGIMVPNCHPQMVSKKGSRALGLLSGRTVLNFCLRLYFVCRTAIPITASASACPSG